MNRVSHMVFALSLFVGLYSLIFAFSIWYTGVGTIGGFAEYYLLGGIVASVVCVPILYFKAPNKDMRARTSSNRGAAGAIFFVTFCLGSLVGTLLYQWFTGVVVIGNISIFLGALLVITGALIPDWDIPFLGISRHRNIIFHSVVIPFLAVLLTVLNVAFRTGTVLGDGAEGEYYLTALVLLGYASHLYLDIFPSDANPLEILWIAADPIHKAPTGIKPWGPIKISAKNARHWLVGNATLLVLFAVFLFAAYFAGL
ncbi:MAG: metal-dependent hydrolase [Candidatus Thorarchaeota archaeon]